MNSPRSVVMVSASFHPYVGGAEKQALELSTALMRRGIAVRVLTRQMTDLPNNDQVSGVPVERLWCAGAGFVNAVTFMMSLGLWLWRRSSLYSVVHVHLAGSPSLPAVAVGRILGKRVIVKLGGGRGIGELAASSATFWGRVKLRALAWLKPQFVAVTRDLAQECAQYLGPVPVIVQPNGVDTDRYHPVSSEDKKALRKKLGWPKGGGFLYVGRFSPEKRLDWFLRAWSEAKDNSSFVVLIGQGPEESQLQSLRTSRILMAPPMEDIAQAYAAADVFVLPSISEGLSNALLEAMSSGLAILGSQVGGTAEAVEDGKTGLLFEPQDEGALKRNLERFLAEPGLAARMGAAARERTVREYSLELAAREYEKLYRTSDV